MGVPPAVMNLLPIRPLTLCLTGDVMTGRGIDQILPHPSQPQLYEPSVRDARDYVSLCEARNGPVPRGASFRYIWGDARGELSRVGPDAHIINLETSVTRSEDAWPGKGIHYRMNPDNVGCLTAARVDVCVLANNHVLDWGYAGLVETLEVLHRAGLQTAGAGLTLEEALRPAVVSLAEGGRILVMGLGHASSGIPDEWEASAQRPGVLRVRSLSDGTAAALGRVLKRTKRPNDVVVASIHWGSNWGYEVPESQIRFAHALLDQGVDIVHGHSSHHPRPIEVYRGKPIFYGCGDLLSDYEGISGFEEFLDNLGLMYFPRVDPRSGKLLHLRMVPMRTRKMRLERASAKDVLWLKETLSRVSRPFGTEIGLASDGSLVIARAQ